MGIKVAATLDTEFKFNYTVSTVLAPAFTVADEDLALWIGNAHPFSKSEELAALEHCLEHIRENGTETPTGANESYAELGTNFKKDVNAAFDSAIDTTLTGTVTVVISTDDVVGVGTAFETELVVGQSIKIAGEIHTVLTITDDENLILATNHAAGAAGVTFALVAVPEEGKVGIWYGPDFQALVDNSITPFVVQLIEHYVETTQASSD